MVDFANIEDEFKKTNQAYFNELQNEFGDELKGFENLFKSEEEILNEIENFNNILFKYNTDNLEIFSEQISKILDKNELSKIFKCLKETKELYNIIRISDKAYLLDKINLKSINFMSSEIANRINLLNQKEILENKADNNGILNIALEEIIFSFKKIKEEELIISDQYKDILKRTRESLASNIDTKDIKFIKLREELERLFKKKNLSEITTEEMNMNINELKDILKNSKKLNQTNDLLKSKYDNDNKFTRVHKRIMESNYISKNEVTLFNALKSIKNKTDIELINNSNIFNNQSFIKNMISRFVIEYFQKNKMELDLDKTQLIEELISNEYFNELNGEFFQ